jgi:hypothetical protein
MPISKSQLAKLEALAREKAKTFKTAEQIASAKRLKAMSDQELSEYYENLETEYLDTCNNTKPCTDMRLLAMSESELTTEYLRACKEG